MIRRTGFALLALLSPSLASAHTAVVGVSPGEGQTVSAPKEVVLTFNEPVSLRFSTFKVYPLAARGTALEVNRAAAALAKTVVTRKDDAASRADRPQNLAGNATQVTLPLKNRLAAGAYVVMWRLLSEDGHPVTGQYVFRVK